MQTKTFAPGDKVKLKTKDKTWTGHALQSHDPEIILLKLSSGYNIGIRENEILDATILEKATPTEKDKPELEQDKKLPNIAMIITGGTISARLDPKTGGTTWTDEGEILNIAPELKDICNIVTIEKPFMKASEDMAFLDYKKIATACEKYLNDDSIDGIIITHGTDFLHYTSAALAFFLRDLNKPVALTYSQRSIDRASTDAALNLICSAKYATSDIAEVALIGHKNTNDNICLAMPATKVRKMHTSRRGAFKIINDTPIAEISPSEIKILKTFNARSNNKVKLDTKFSDNVALIKIFPGQNPDILEFYANKNYKGIILELGGLGHAPGRASQSNWLPKIKQLAKKIPIFAVPQTIYGRLNPNVYSAGRDLQKTGITFLEDMLPEAAFIKLGWVLGHKQWNTKQKMLQNISKEFNKK
jgi:glutamyl-tRNA(Gln) amidotransferase subunit D